MKKLISILALVMGASSLLAADAANDVLLNQRNGTNDDNVQRNVTATANSLFAFDGSLIPTATAAPILASVQANASGGLLLKNFSGTTVMNVGPGSGTGVAFNASGLTSVNSVTAADSTALTLTGGSSGASLVLGAGTAAKGVFTGGSATGMTLDLVRTTGTTGANATFAQINGYNGSANRAAIIDFTGAGAVDSGQIDFWTKATGTGIAQIARLTSTGNLLIGTTTDITGSGGLHVAGTSTASTTTSGALRVGFNVGLSGNAGGASYFGGQVNIAASGANGLIVRPASGNSLAIFDASAGGADANAYITLQTSGTNRWVFGQSISTAAGDFEIYSTPLGASALKLAKATGAATFAGAVTANGQLIGKGTATNDSAATGYIGEYVSSTIAQASAVSLTTATTASVTSISLTAGDWDIEGNVAFIPQATTVRTRAIGCIFNSVGLPTSDKYSTVNYGTADASANIFTVRPVSTRYSLSATTTIYLTTYADFSAGTLSAFGFIAARRVR
jgi:hypothetical protein